MTHLLMSTLDISLEEAYSRDVLIREMLIRHVIGFARGRNADVLSFVQEHRVVNTHPPIAEPG